MWCRYVLLLTLCLLPFTWQACTDNSTYCTGYYRSFRPQTTSLKFHPFNAQFSGASLFVWYYEETQRQVYLYKEKPSISFIGGYQMVSTWDSGRYQGDLVVDESHQVLYDQIPTGDILIRYKSGGSKTKYTLPTGLRITSIDVDSVSSKLYLAVQDTTSKQVFVARVVGLTGALSIDLRYGLSYTNLVLGKSLIQAESGKIMVVLQDVIAARRGYLMYVEDQGTTMVMAWQKQTSELEVVRVVVDDTHCYVSLSDTTRIVALKKIALGDGASVWEKAISGSPILSALTTSPIGFNTQIGNLLLPIGNYLLQLGQNDGNKIAEDRYTNIDAISILTQHTGLLQIDKPASCKIHYVFLSMQTTQITNEKVFLIGTHSSILGSLTPNVTVQYNTTSLTVSNEQSSRNIASVSPAITLSLTSNLTLTPQSITGLNQQILTTSHSLPKEDLFLIPDQASHTNLVQAQFNHTTAFKHTFPSQICVDTPSHYSFSSSYANGTTLPSTISLVSGTVHNEYKLDYTSMNSGITTKFVTEVKYRGRKGDVISRETLTKHCEANCDKCVEDEAAGYDMKCRSTGCASGFQIDTTGKACGKIDYNVQNMNVELCKIGIQSIPTPTVVVGRSADATTTCTAVVTAKSYFAYDQTTRKVTVSPSGTSTLDTSSIPVTCSNSVLSVTKTIQVKVVANTDQLGWDHDSNPSTPAQDMSASLTLKVPQQVNYTLPTPIKQGTQSSATTSMIEPSPAGKYRYDASTNTIYTTHNETTNSDITPGGLLIKIKLTGCSKTSLFTLILTITQNTSPTFSGGINNQEYIIDNGIHTYSPAIFPQVNDDDPSKTTLSMHLNSGTIPTSDFTYNPSSNTLVLNTQATGVFTFIYRVTDDAHQKAEISFQIISGRCHQTCTDCYGLSLSQCSTCKTSGLFLQQDGSSKLCVEKCYKLDYYEIELPTGNECQRLVNTFDNSSAFIDANLVFEIGQNQTKSIHPIVKQTQLRSKFDYEIHAVTPASSHFKSSVGWLQVSSDGTQLIGKPSVSDLGTNYVNLQVIRRTIDRNIAYQKTVKLNVVICTYDPNCETCTYTPSKSFCTKCKPLFQLHPYDNICYKLSFIQFNNSTTTSPTLTYPKCQLTYQIFNISAFSYIGNITQPINLTTSTLSNSWAKFNQTSNLLTVNAIQDETANLNLTLMADVNGVVLSQTYQVRVVAKSKSQDGNHVSKYPGCKCPSAMQPSHGQICEVQKRKELKQIRLTKVLAFTHVVVLLTGTVLSTSSPQAYISMLNQIQNTQIFQLLPIELPSKLKAMLNEYEFIKSDLDFPEEQSEWMSHFKQWTKITTKGRSAKAQDIGLFHGSFFLNYIPIYIAAVVYALLVVVTKLLSCIKKSLLSKLPNHNLLLPQYLTWPLTKLNSAARFYVQILCYDILIFHLVENLMFYLYAALNEVLAVDVKSWQNVLSFVNSILILICIIAILALVMTITMCQYKSRNIGKVDQEQEGGEEEVFTDQNPKTKQQRKYELKLARRQKCASFCNKRCGLLINWGEVGNTNPPAQQSHTRLTYFLQQFRFLYKDTKPSLLGATYQLFFLIRRTILIIAVFLHTSWLALGIMFIAQLVFVGYILLSKPMLKAVDNLTIFINEITFSFMILVLLIFCSSSMPGQVQSMMLSVLIGSQVLGMCIIIYNQCNVNISLWMIRYCSGSNNDTSQTTLTQTNNSQVRITRGLKSESQIEHTNVPISHDQQPSFDQNDSRLEQQRLRPRKSKSAKSLWVKQFIEQSSMQNLYEDDLEIHAEGITPEVHPQHSYQSFSSSSISQAPSKFQDITDQDIQPFFTPRAIKRPTIELNPDTGLGVVEKQETAGFSHPSQFHAQDTQTQNLMKLVPDTKSWFHIGGRDVTQAIHLCDQIDKRDSLIQRRLRRAAHDGVYSHENLHQQNELKPEGNHENFREERKMVNNYNMMIIEESEQSVSNFNQ